MKPQPQRDRLLERFHASVDHGDVRRASRLLTKIESKHDDADAAFARWRLATVDDDLEAALKAAQRAVEKFPSSADLHHALGWTLLELGEAASACGFLEEACFLDQDFADAWYDLGVARELTGDVAGMRQAFGEVYDIDTDPGRPPLRYAEEQSNKWAERAMQTLPGDVLDASRDVPIFVQDYPDRWILEDAPWDPRLLGLFDGPTWAELRATDSMMGVQSSPHVYLYQRNLERVCADSRAMAEQVRITLHHEIGHFLGLDEDDLHERGLG